MPANAVFPSLPVLVLSGDYDPLTPWPQGVAAAKEFPNARFVVITALNGDDCIRQALNLGAHAFLHKDMLRRELLAAIRAVHQGEKYLPLKIANWIKKER